MTAFFSWIPRKDCWVAITERAYGGLWAYKEEGGWDESIKICTIANVIAVDAFVVGKGVCAGRVSCRAASPTSHPHGLQSVATGLRERSEKWPFKAKINVVFNISARWY